MQNQVYVSNLGAFGQRRHIVHVDAVLGGNVHFTVGQMFGNRVFFADNAPRMTMPLHEFRENYKPRKGDDE